MTKRNLLTINFQPPPYSYVSGLFPHPTRDPHGHSYQADDRQAAQIVLSEANWERHKAYRHGVLLFNHGYYWEAHESWEDAWRELPRDSPMGRFLQGLIKLAAAGVKARENRSAGVKRHAERARQLFTDVVADDSLRQSSVDGSASNVFCGLDLNDMQQKCELIGRRSESLLDDRPDPVVIVMPFTLTLQPVFREASATQSARESRPQGERP